MSLDETQARQERERRRKLGEALRITGILIATLCGLCTATCAGPSAVGMAMGEGDEYDPMVLTIASVIGVLPFLVGVGLALWGNWLIKTRARAEERQTP
jgi:hypothetical protein